MPSKRKDLFEGIAGSTVSDDAGPISMGWRLANQPTAGADDHVVYGKGIFVLHMLRQLMRDGGQQNPDASFIAMTRDFVTTWSGEYPATADFQRMIEKQIRPAMNATGEGKVDWFFRQWVHGTEVSKLEGDFAVARPGNGYRITGSLTHPGVSSEFRTIVSLYVELEGKRGAILAQASAILILGALTRQLDLTVNLPSPPKRALINAHRDVLTRR